MSIPRLSSLLIIAALLTISIPGAATPRAASPIANHAGPAAWWIAPGPIDLAAIRPLLRSIEMQSAEYLIGSLPIPGYDQSIDVHLYASAAGHLLAYYPRSTPLAKISDWLSPPPADRLTHALTIAANAAGQPVPQPTYYHFQYPGANRFTLAVQNKSDITIDIDLPAEIEYYEFSASMDADINGYCVPAEHGIYYLDNSAIINRTGTYNLSLTLSPLAPGRHTMLLDYGCGKASAALGIIYTSADPITTPLPTLLGSLILSPILSAGLSQLPAYPQIHASSAAKPAVLQSPTFDLPVYYQTYIPNLRRTK